MNVNELILGGLDRAWGLCDNFDEMGFAVYEWTEGKRTTKEQLQLDLVQFLVWVGNMHGRWSESTSGLIHIVLGHSLDTKQMKKLYNYGEPDSNTASLGAYMCANLEHIKRNSTLTSEYTDFLISLFNCLGLTICEIDHNSTGKAKVMKYIQGMKSIVEKNSISGDSE